MRLKLIEILKFIVAAAIGFTFRVMIETSYYSLPNNSNNPGEINSELNIDNLHERLVQPYQPKSLKEVIEYRYFNLSMVFDTHLGQIETKMKSYHQNDIKDIIKQIRTHINLGHSNKYKVKAFLNGFERIDPIRGKEYIIDLEFERGIGHEKISRVYRINIVKPFDYAQIVSQVDVSFTKRHWINLLYVFGDDHLDSDKTNNKLPKLIESVLLNHQSDIINRVPVNVTFYFCTNKVSIDYLTIILNKWTNSYKSYENYHLNYVIEKFCDFKASKIKNKAIKSFKSNERNFIILDPHINITSQFIERCHAILSDSVNSIYVPIPFVEFKILPSNLQNHRNIGEQIGIWDHDNYEVLCINRIMFEQGNQFDEKQTFDKSTQVLIENLIQKKRDIIRSTDPSVRLSYHQLECKDQTNMRYSTYETCINRQKKTYMPLQQLYETINIK